MLMDYVLTESGTQKYTCWDLAQAEPTVRARTEFVEVKKNREQVKRDAKIENLLEDLPFGWYEKYWDNERRLEKQKKREY